MCVCVHTYIYIYISVCIYVCISRHEDYFGLSLRIITQCWRTILQGSMGIITNIVVLVSLQIMVYGTSNRPLLIISPRTAGIGRWQRSRIVLLIFISCQRFRIIWVLSLINPKSREVQIVKKGVSPSVGAVYWSLLQLLLSKGFKLIPSDIAKKKCAGIFGGCNGFEGPLFLDSLSFGWTRLSNVCWRPLCLGMAARCPGVLFASP